MQYNPDFIEFRPILSEDDKRHLHDLSVRYPLERLKSDARNFEEMAVDLEFLCNLHAVLMKDLLPSHKQGLVRTSAVQIGASSYKSIADPSRLRVEMGVALAQAGRYTDPFELATCRHQDTGAQRRAASH